MKKMLIVGTILFSVLLLTGCSLGAKKERSKEKEGQEKIEKKAVSENNYSSADNVYTVNNENFVGPDFEVKLTGSTVTQGADGVTYLVVFYTFSNKTNQFKQGQEVFEKHITANQESNQEAMESLVIAHPELSESIQRLLEESTNEQEQGKSVQMATAYKTVSEKELRLDFLDGEGAAIVSKAYLIK